MRCSREQNKQELMRVEYSRTNLQGETQVIHFKPKSCTSVTPATTTLNPPLRDYEEIRKFLLK